MKGDGDESRGFKKLAGLLSFGGWLDDGSPPSSLVLPRLAAAGGPKDEISLGILKLLTKPDAIPCKRCAAPCKPGDAGESKMEPGGGWG